jgi:D-arabinose 1-dehydrogenase-like Zn-dependent alcohol dehydrogenase
LCNRHRDTGWYLGYYKNGWAKYPKSLDKMLHNSSAGATLLLLGLPYFRREFSFESIVAYDKAIIGSVGSSAEDFEDTTYIFPQLDLHHFTQTVLPLDKFEEGWNIVRQGQKLKVLLEVDEQL